MLWRIAIGVAAGVLLVWGVLVLFLVLAKPKGSVIKGALRLLPDTVRLLRRLAADAKLPRAWALSRPS